MLTLLYHLYVAVWFPLGILCVVFRAQWIADRLEDLGIAIEGWAYPGAVVPTSPPSPVHPLLLEPRAPQS